MTDADISELMDFYAVTILELCAVWFVWFFFQCTPWFILIINIRIVHASFFRWHVQHRREQIYDNEWRDIISHSFLQSYTGVELYKFQPSTENQSQKILQTKTFLQMFHKKTTSLTSSNMHRIVLLLLHAIQLHQKWKCFPKRFTHWFFL